MSHFCISAQCLTKVFLWCGRRRALLKWSKVFPVEMLYYCFWATFCIRKRLHLIRWSAGVFLDNTSSPPDQPRRNFLVGWPLVFLVQYHWRSFQKFTAAVLIHPISPPMTRRERPRICDFATPKLCQHFRLCHVLSTVKQEIPVGDVDYSNTWKQMNKFC